MVWKKMRIRVEGGESSLPGDRGRYLLWLEPPFVEREAHYIHFSWNGESFCLRDYIQHLERRQTSDCAASDIWEAATDRIPCKGELYIPVENFEFWVAKLTELSDQRRRPGKQFRFWPRLSSKFAAKPAKVPHKNGNSNKKDDRDFYARFVESWPRGGGFDVIERTVGCSARYQGEPLLWVFPKYFRVAPQGKGNAHKREVMELRDKHFPEVEGKATVFFQSPHFSWERFGAFISEVQEMMQKPSI